MPFIKGFFTKIISKNRKLDANSFIDLEKPYVNDTMNIANMKVTLISLLKIKTM